MKEIIVITGTSSGFGALAARALARAGHTVYASMRETRGRNAAAVEELKKYAYESGAMQAFRSRLFTRIVPILKEIGLFGPKMQKALGDMGVMEYAKIDVEKLIGNDMKVAEDFDAKTFVRTAIAAQ